MKFGVKKYKKLKKHTTKREMMLMTVFIRTLVQDNGSCNDNIKKAVRIPEDSLVYEIGKYFGWRKDVTVSRLYKQSSHNYDLFIKYLTEKGYGI